LDINAAFPVKVKDDTLDHHPTTVSITEASWTSIPLSKLKFNRFYFCDGSGADNRKNVGFEPIGRCGCIPKLSFPANAATTQRSSRRYRRQRIGTIKDLPTRRDAERAILALRVNINSAVCTPER
jgi:hypothetical protein